MKSDISKEALIRDYSYKSDPEITEYEGVDKSIDKLKDGYNYNQESTMEISEQKFVLYRFRWIIQIFFTIGFIQSGFILVAFSPIAEIIAKMFNCSSVIVQAQTLVFLIACVPGNFIAIWVQDKYGLRICIMIGSGMTFGGAWLRQLIEPADDFNMCFLGTTICAFGQVFYMNIQSKFASTWFGDNERALSTALCSLSMPIGCIIGFVVPALMVNEQSGKSDFYSYLTLQNTVVTIGSLPIFLFAREKPPTPPSKSANIVVENLDFKKEFKQLMSNKSYLLLTVTFSCLYGIYSSLGAVVSSITGPYGYTSTDNAIFGGLFIFCGVIGSFVIGMLLDKYKRFKLTINIITILASVFNSTTFYTLQSQSVVLLSINLMFVGFTVIPIIPSSYAFAVELTYPVSESMSNGMMIIPSQLFGTFLGIGASTLCIISPMYAIGLFLGCALIGAVASLFIKEELRRLKPKQLLQSQITDESVSNKGLQNQSTIENRQQN